MTRFASDSKDRVREAVDMLALVSTRTELRRAGVNSYFGVCPFHDERTASFHVRPDEKHFHCFGCQESGDPFDFVMQTEGLDFKAALESLANRFGVTLEVEGEDPEAAQRRERRERLHSLLERATTYYARYLWEAREAEAARDYLLGRGLEEATLKAFRVGYAPSAWDTMLMASRRAGFSEEELLAVGLIQRSSKDRARVMDRFRERIMFPAVDARGRVHGFGARRMRENQFGPKYLNTSDGEIYHKREVLFGIDLARATAAKAGRMILVEGYTDVLALHQAGIGNAVGIMGTSLTEEQINELQRVVTTLELCLDADRAGQEAMMRASRLAAGRSLELRVVDLPEGKDPADLIAAEGIDGLRRRVEASAPFVVFNVNRILAAADTRSAEGRGLALAELAPLLNELPNGVLRDDLVRRVAGRLELSESRLATELASPPVVRSDRAGAAANGTASERPPVGQVLPGPGQPGWSERVFVAMCIAVPERGAAALADPALDELITSGLLRRAARHLAGHLHAPESELPPEDVDLARAVSTLIAQARRVPDPSSDRLEHTRLILELEGLERAIRRARSDGAGISELARRREVVRQQRSDVAARLEGTV